MGKPSRRSIFSVLGSLRRSTKKRVPLSSVTKRLFALSFTSEFIVVYPFYVIMFGERGDVSAAGVGVLLASWMVVSVLAEVPTGIIADKVSKKWSLAFGHALQALTFGIWLLVPNFTGYLIGFVVWGVGEAFISGAFQAYLYESLDDDNKKTFGKIFSRSRAFTMLAYTSGGFLAFLIGPEYPLLLILSVAVALVSVGIVVSLPATRAQVEVEIRPKILAGALKAIRTSPDLRRILFTAVIALSLMGAAGEYLGQYYQQVGLPTQTVALFISVGSATAALLYWWMHHVESQISRYQLAIMLAATALFALTFLGGALVAVLGMFVFTRVLRVITVNNESLIQHHAPNESRATVGSLYSFAGKLFAAGIVAVIGVTAVNDQVVAPIRWSVLVIVVVFALATLSSRFRKQRMAPSTKPIT